MYKSFMINRCNVQFYFRRASPFSRSLWECIRVAREGFIIHSPNKQAPQQLSE